VGDLSKRAIFAMTLSDLERSFQILDTFPIWKIIAYIVYETNSNDHVT